MDRRRQQLVRSRTAVERRRQQLRVQFNNLINQISTQGLDYYCSRIWSTFVHHTQIAIGNRIWFTGLDLYGYLNSTLNSNNVPYRPRLAYLEVLPGRVHLNVQQIFNFDQVGAGTNFGASPGVRCLRYLLFHFGLENQIIIGQLVGDGGGGRGIYVSFEIVLAST